MTRARISATLLVVLLALARLACAAPPAVARVGYLGWTGSGLYHDVTSRGFVAGLRDEGFVEGRNVIVLRRSADGDPSRFERLAAELAAEKVDVFFAPATPMANAAWYVPSKKPKRKTPIVIATIADPVALEFVRTLSRPGTQVTGVTTMNDALALKRLQLFAEVLSGASATGRPEGEHRSARREGNPIGRIGVIVSDAMRKACGQEDTVLRAAAQRLGIELEFAGVERSSELDAAFRRFSEDGVRGVMNTLMTTSQGMEREFVAASLEHRVATMSELAETARLGALLSYGPDFEDLFRRAGRYTGRILKGEDPAVMPMERPREFRLAVNLSTARALGVTVPQSILLRADEVIP